jgi:uncharacterized linocin/CFP29 family protein
MADMLKRGQAPLTEDAWEEIDDAVSDVLKAHLAARGLVDFSGPRGWEFAGVNLGRMEVGKRGPVAGVPWGLRTVQPLVEVRMGFALDRWELDNVARGCKDPDVGPAEEAARKVALFEETAIFKGFAGGQIKGVLPASEHKPVRMTANARQMPSAVADALQALQQAAIGGPYALVLGTDAYHTLMQAGESGYPPRRIVRDMIGGPIVWSPALDGGVLLSQRGGDFELTVGQDLAIGYQHSDNEKVHLFLTESFTFQVLEPKAAVELKTAAK